MQTGGELLSFLTYQKGGGFKNKIELSVVFLGQLKFQDYY